MELGECTLLKIKDELEDLHEDRPEFVKIKEEIEDVKEEGSEFVSCRDGINGENSKQNALPVNCAVKIEYIKTEIKQEKDVDEITVLNSSSEIKDEQIVEENLNTTDKVVKRRKPRNTEVQCKECGLVCRNRRIYKLHVMDHTGRPFKCDKCEKAYKKSTDLLYHKKTHTGDHDIHCDYCGKGFTVKSALRAHMRTHSKEKPYVCHICNRGFSHSSSLKPHIAMHSETFPFECDQCDKKFKISKNLASHKRTHAAEGGNGEQCSFCPKQYKSKEGLRLHLLKHKQPQAPDGSPLLYTCEQCGNSYKHSVSLRNHQRTHSGNMFACHKCGKSYITIKLLDIHVRNHTGETPFSCDVCDKKFKRRDSWLYHKTTHQNDRRMYQCDMCEKVLVCKSSLRVHKTYFHSNRKPHQCIYCLQSFKLRYDLTRHLRKHVKTDESNAENTEVKDAAKPEAVLVKEEICKDSEAEEPNEISKDCEAEESSGGGFDGHVDVFKVFKCKCKNLFDDEHEFKRHKRDECPLLATRNGLDKGDDGNMSKRVKEEVLVKTENSYDES